MLLLHQTGSVRVGEVVRYSLTYTPSLDRILPPPNHLYVKVKNTSAVPLRAAYLHGPYTLYAACYPSTFDPYKKDNRVKEEGEPDYEPQLKAGGSWNAKLTVPEEVREGSADGGQSDHIERKRFTWIIEVSSQVLFSTTAAVHYEVLVGRDEKSVSLGLNGVVSSRGMPGKLEDHQQGRHRDNAQPKGVFSRAVGLKVEDTAALWDIPPFPTDDEADFHTTQQDSQAQEQKNKKNKMNKKKQRIHLVILTHGLHSNVGADMLFMKERIDAAAKQAREDAKKKNAELREKRVRGRSNFGRKEVDQRSRSVPEVMIAPTEPAGDDTDDEDNEEQVIVRGFNGNAVKTERGIQYLGKRLAKYVLSITYPDQPYLPVKSSISQSISRTLTGGLKPTQTDGKQPSHKNSSIAKDEKDTRNDLPYQITSISFIGHSLGGLTQTYAIAYIQKHSPEFFKLIKPINFVALATPFLGLSNENPMYVKFALDFGLVGRTGQDLGLTWRAPTIARNGWGAMVGGLGGDAGKEKEPDPGAKPLLRILPTGPAHVALKKFRNRTVYSNVVNDGIVPLRTSCLLFLDWRGLGRVEKARRENGLVGTMVNWGFAEITGQNASAPRRGLLDDFFTDSGDEHKPRSGKTSPDPGSAVPEAEASLGLDQEAYTADDAVVEPESHQQLSRPKFQENADGTSFWTTFTSFFRPQAGSKKPKQQRIYRRGQTMRIDKDDSEAGSESPEGQSTAESSPRKGLVRGSSLYTNNSENENLEAPPKTTVFESAGDLLNPPLPPKEFLLDPSQRPRTIFHDRVYHPDDIPPPPAKRQRTFMRKPLSRDGTVPNQANSDLQKISSTSQEQGTMRIEEKIARAYHKDMSWRKVLVCLEPDAHNNLIVRRMFANAYGWPVVKHLCDTHFAYTAAAKTRDAEEPSDERAKPQESKVGRDGEHVKDQVKPPTDNKIEELNQSSKLAKVNSSENLPDEDENSVTMMHERHQRLHAARAQSQTVRTARSPSELRESQDQVSDLVSMVSAHAEPASSFNSMHSGTAALHRLARQDSARWSDRFFEGSEDESDDEGFIAKELEQAQGRGQAAGFKMSPKSTTSTTSTISNKEQDNKVQVPAQNVLSESSRKIIAEPEQLSRSTSKEMAPDLQTLSLSGIGLGKSLQEMVSDGMDSNRRRSSDQPISEQVARAQAQSSTSN